MSTHDLWEKLPRPDQLSGLSEDGSYAVSELLELVVYADERITRPEVETLKRELSALPRISTNLTERLEGERGFFARAENYGVPSREEIKAIVARIDDEQARLATLRLVAVLSCGDGLDAREVALYDMITDALGLEREFAQQVLRSAWSAKQAA